jgi:hypothetical protein
MMIDDRIALALCVVTSIEIQTHRMISHLDEIHTADLEQMPAAEKLNQDMMRLP